MRTILQLVYKEKQFCFSCGLRVLKNLLLKGQICFTVIFFLSSLISKSQTNYFQKTIGGNNEDLGRFVQQTTDGGFISIGSTKSYGSGAFDVYVVKTSVNGNVLWSKIFGGNNDDQGFSGQQTADGGYIITGYTASFGSGQDVLLIKIDNLGNLLWTKRYGSTNEERGYSVQQTSDLGYIIAGYTKSGFSAGAEDIYLIKTDANGNVLWENAYGGNNEEFAYSVQQTSSGMFIVTGDTRSFGAGSQDMFLMKTNGAGGLLFFKTFGGNNADFGYSVKQLSNGKYLIGGSTRSFGAGGDDMFLVNTDTLGLLQFSRTYGGGNNDFCYSVKETTSGQFIFGGSERSFGGGGDDAYLIKTNNTGGLIWSKSYGGGNDDYLNCVNQMSNGQFVLLGTTRTFGVGSDDFYLLRTDTVGKTGCNETSPVSIVTSPIIVAGNFPPSVNPGGVTNIPPIILNSNFDLTTLLCQCIAPPNITGSSAICPGLTSTLAASGGTAYLWSTGATTSLIAVSPTLTSIYSVTVSNGFCSDTASFKVSVYAPPVITINPSTATICSGTSVLLTASGASTYVWSPATGLSCSACSSPTASPVSSTIYTVTGTDVNGCTNTQTASVTSIPLPTISVSPPAPAICIGSAVTLTATGANSYGWSPATGLSCNNCATPVANPTVTSTYTITGTATTGCIGTKTITIVVNGLPTITVSPISANLCAGASTIFTASGANSYSWSPSIGLSCTNCASPSANATTTTIFTVTGTDLNGCSNIKTATLVINPLPPLAINPASPTICIGSSTVLSASGAASYTWMPSSGLSCTTCASPAANPVSSTVYTLTGTSASGCLNSKTITVTVNPLPVITISPATSTLCIGSSTVLTASGANTYTWSPMASLSCSNCANTNATPTITTTYTVTGADLNGCTNTATSSIVINPLPVITISPASATLCLGASTGLSASGAVSYSWSPVAGLSCTNCANPTANPTLTTTYTVSGTNANGCVNTKTITISVNPLPVIALSPSSPSICIGSSVVLSASGASSYTWAPSTALSCTVCPSSTANPSISSTYTVTGTDVNGCVNTKIVTVFVNPLPTLSITPSSATICIGSSTVLSASGASTYSWGSVTGLSCTNCASPTVNPTVSITYTVTGSDANGCINTKTVSVIVNPLPVITISPTTATICIGSSTVLSASGGTSYIWSPAVGLSCTNCVNPTANPTITTTYTVSGTSATGCVNTKTVTVSINPLPTINVSPGSATICSGSAVLLNASGAGSYSWNPATGLSCSACSSPTANPSASTVYTVTGTDSNGCSNTQTTSVITNSLPVISISPVSPSICIGSSAVLTATGANSYGWSPATALSCNNCPSPAANPTVNTSYTVTGTNINGCTNTKTITVFVNSLPVISISPASVTYCAGGSTILSASGANNYSWSPSTGLSCTNCASPSANPTITTTYTVTGTDLNGCVNTKTITITVNPLPVLIINPSTPTICTTSSVVLNASGASTYTWVPASGLSCTNCSSPTANPSSSTVYTLTGASAVGCVDSKTVFISINPSPTVNASPSSATLCAGASTSFSASGASSYSWSPSTGLSCITCSNPNANPTITTTYTLIGTDANGCTNTTTTNLIINSLPVITTNPISATLCIGSSVALSASGAVSYTWSPNATLSCTICANPSATPTISTIYTVTGTNANGCIGTKTLSVTVNTPPIVGISPSTSTLCSGSSVALTASGATNYTWSPASGLSCTVCSSPIASPSISTTYTVTGSNVTGCIGTNSSTVFVNPVLVVTVSPVSSTICVGGSVALNSSGAVSYTWSPSNELSCSNCSNPTASPTITTTYTVTGVDNNGCINTKTVSVIVNSLPSVNINPASSTLCAGGSTTLSASGSNSYSWTPSIGLSCTNCSILIASPTVTTIYTVTGTNSNGCSNTTTTSVNVNSMPVLTVSPQSGTLCSGGSISLNVFGANSYAWSPINGLSCSGCSNPTASPSITTTYTITGTDVNGCVNTKTITVVVNSLPTITISPSSAALCLGDNVSLAATGANNYVWTPIAGLSCTNCATTNANPTISTTYSVIGTNLNGCSSTKTISVIINPLPVIAVNPSSSTICIGSSASLTASGASSYVWSPSSGLSCTNCAGPIATPSVNTNYTLTGTDGNGCVNIVTMSITVNSLPVISVNPTSASLCLGTSTVITASGANNYIWSPFSGLSCNNCPNPTANPTVTTTYTVTGTSITGCVNTKTVTIAISPSLALFVSPNTATLCSGNSIGIIASGAVGYFWSPSAGLSCNSCPNPTANPTITTTYTVIGTAVSGCASATIVTINVNTLPSVIITPGSATLCIGDSVSLNASGAGTFAWSPAAGLSCTNCPNPIASPTNNLIYTVVGTDFNGCSKTQTISVTVNPLPLITFSISPSNSICIGSSATIAASGSSTYTWSPPTGISCINCSVTIATPSTNITYTLSGTNNGCVNTKTVTINVNPLPAISASPVSTTVCLGSSVTLNASGGTSYTWSPSNGLSCSNCIAPTANPTTSTVYSLIGSDVNGCQNSQTVSINVNPLPVINVNQSTIFLCAGTSTLVSATGANSYTWSPSIGLNCNVCASATATPNSNTTYSVFGSDVNGCVNSNTINITVDPLPVVTLNPNFAIQCAGKSSSITATGATNYMWAPLTGLSCGNCSLVIASPSISTNYTVTGYTANGCSSTQTIGITVNPLPVITFIPSSATLCIGSSTAVSVSGATTYTWVTSAGLSCNTCNNPILNPTVSTIYSVTAKDVNGCVDTKPYSVIVGQPIIASITGDSILCAGTNIILQGSGGTQYSWSNGVSTSTTLISPTITSTYTLIATKLGCMDTVLKTITVYTVPVANAGSDVTINYGNSISLSGAGGGLYNWSPNFNLSCSTCANPIASPTVSTMYILTVTNNLGCSNSDTMYVNVDKVCGDVFVPNVFSPNGDNQNDVLFVENRCLESIEFMIYDRWGEKVFETTDPKVGWDGTYKGIMMNGGGFVYYLVARLVNRDDLVVKKGNIMILR